ncbi:MAG: hypothetical protein ABSG56_37880 [Bryobacteraceae bacterium]|jgi:hypothetical protein
MIYETVAADRPIRQGDIFRHVPRVDMSLTSLPVVEDDGTREENWQTIELNSEVTAVLSVKSVTGIVITQNCDAQRGEYICLAQVDPFLAVLGEEKQPRNPDKWQSLIIRQAKTNFRLFYLPADETVGFSEPMVADFRIILRVSHIDLENFTDKRVGALDRVAGEHFRESIAHFFRRYAYNEWYSLTKEQFEAYSRRCEEPLEPFPWQK